jgi:photosystem II stability/assembly factor-like uncharacterized protein
VDTRILVGTESGLWQLRGDALEPVDPFTARTVTALARRGHETWAIVDGRALWRGDEGTWTEQASLDDRPATSLATMPNGLLIGTAQAHLLRCVGDTLTPVESFETVEGREAWHTPWGDPADVRSIAVGLDGAIYVNVHVGGVVRSRDAGRTWTPTLDIDVDVHQVIAHPERPDHVLVAAYDGFGISRDGGDSWHFVTEGMHAHYARAVAVSGETVLVSASTGPRGRKATLYRKPLDGSTEFARCKEGLPWFDDNIDTGCLAADGSLVVFGTDDGRVFRSLDGGAHWSLVTKGLPTITAVTIG